MRLVMLGPPGVGKGTQAHRLAEERKLPHVSTGDILRAAIQNKTEVGLKAKSFMDEGKLVPDEVVVAIIEERLRTPELGGGFILDGFPRTLPQAKALDASLKRLSIAIDHVVYFNAEDEVLVERITGRRACKKCQTNFHIKHLPPKQEGLCDKCGGELFQREDDKEATVRRRLEVYRQQTSELIPFYEAASLLRTIDGQKSPDDVYAAFAKVVG